MGGRRDVARIELDAANADRDRAGRAAEVCPPGAEVPIFVEARLDLVPVRDSHGTTLKPPGTEGRLAHRPSAFVGYGQVPLPRKAGPAFWWMKSGRLVGNGAPVSGSVSIVSAVEISTHPRVSSALTK